MSNDIQNTRQSVFTPAETSTMGVEYIKSIEANKHRAMPFPVAGMADYFAPLMPGQTCMVVAQTSNYKTGFMDMWEKHLAHYLAANGREDEIIIHADTENTVEGLALQEIARLSDHSVADLSRGNVRNWKSVMAGAFKIAGVNVYRIADQLGQTNAPELYLSNIYRAIKYMTDGSLLDRRLKPACIFIDYLQALPIDPEAKQAERGYNNQRRLQVRQDVYRIKAMAKYFNCPVVVGCQAKQALSTSGSPIKLPGIYDAEESSSIAQRATRSISLWMPKMTERVGSYIQLGDSSFEVQEDDIWIKVLKQQGGLPSGKSWHCKIDYTKNSIRTL